MPERAQIANATENHALSRLLVDRAELVGAKRLQLCGLFGQISHVLLRALAGLFLVQGFLFVAFWRRVAV